MIADILRKIRCLQQLDSFTEATYYPGQNWQVKRHYSYQEVCRATLASKLGYIEIVTEILSCEIEEIENIFKNLNEERWSMPRLDISDYGEEFSEEELQEINQSSQTFDLFKDFDAYYVDFIHFYQIDLLDDKVEWMRFRMLLIGLFNYESNLAERIRIRKYQPAKHDSVEYKQAMFTSQKQFSLNESSPEDFWKKITEGGMFNG